LLLLLHLRQIDAASCTLTSASACNQYTTTWQLSGFGTVLYRDTAPYPSCTVTVLWPRWRRLPGPYPDAASGKAY